MEGNATRQVAQVDEPAMVGRAEELGELDAVLDRAVRYTTPQVVSLVGSQGVGKSRLLGEWREQALQRYPELRVLSCEAADRESSYGVFAALLEDRFRLREATDRIAALRAVAEDVLEDRRLTEVLHFLGSYLGISVPDTPFLRALEDVPRQHDQIARTVLRRFLERDAERGPLVLILEDLHRADEDSLSLFRELAQELEGAPLVLVGSFGPELFVRHPDFCELDAEHLRLDLAPLGRDEGDQVLRHLLRRLPEIPEALMEDALEVAAGNPFFMKELVRVLLDNGTIRVEGDAWEVAAEDPGALDLPVSVEEAVQARVSALSPAERDVLEKAATLGSVFWFEALICFSRLQREVEVKGDLWMADVEQHTIREILEGLNERDYILKMPDSSIPGATEYAFKHNLERELITKMVSPQKMTQYHLFAAQWLETQLQNRSESQIEYLGEHYFEGGNLRRAAFCFVHAGDKARSRYANAQAAAFYRRGLAALGLDDVLAKLEALHNLGDVYAMLGRHDEAIEQFSEMLHNAWLLDHRAKGGAAHRRLGRIHRTLGDYERALAHLNSAARLFDQAEDRPGIAATLDDVGQVGLLQGQYDQALEFHRQALAIKRNVGTPRSIAVSLSHIGRVHQASGSYDEALSCFTEALDLHREVGDEVGVVEGLINLGGVARAQSEYVRAAELWSEALENSRKIGARLHEAALLARLGEVQIQLGKLREAEEQVLEALALAEGLGDQHTLVSGRRTMAEIKLARGTLEPAWELAERSREVAARLGLKLELGAALRVQGQVAAAEAAGSERKGRAEQLLRAAIEIFTDLGDDLELARTFSALADLKDGLGEWEDAEHFRASADDIMARLAAAGQSAAS